MGNPSGSYSLASTWGQENGLGIAIPTTQTLNAQGQEVQRRLLAITGKPANDILLRDNLPKFEYNTLVF